MPGPSGVTGHVRQIGFAPGVNFTWLEVTLVNQHTPFLIEMGDNSELTWDGAAVSGPDLVSHVAGDLTTVTLYPQPGGKTFKADFMPYKEPDAQ